MVDNLERMHNLGYVHGDLKPDNMLLATPESKASDFHQIYLIDFGLSRSWKKENGKHVDDKHRPFNSNEWFASKHQFNNHTYSRRDDIICLVYSLLYLYT
jgi:serine/threonine protein kinase